MQEQAVGRKSHSSTLDGIGLIRQGGGIQYYRALYLLD
jgi:hypothetical protein